MPNNMNYTILIEQLSDTKFRFDGVLYYNKNLGYFLRTKKFRALMASSKIIEGKPPKNEHSYLFITRDDELILTTNKYWNEKPTKEVMEGLRYDLLWYKKAREQLKT